MMENGPFGRKEKILLVEDNPDILEALVVIFRLKGFGVSTLTRGDQVMDAVLSSKPDLIVLDVIIPAPDGLTLCSLLKNREATRRIPVILLSARCQKDDIEQGALAGADRYITKPFQNGELLATVNKLLEETYASLF